MATTLLSTFALLVSISVLLNDVVEARNLIFEGSGDMCFLACPKIYSPVCGSNGKTYGNECLLLQDKECNGLPLKKENDGPCKRRVFPKYISDYRKQDIRKHLCNGNRLTVCSLMGGLCVKTHNGNDYFCLLSKVDREYAGNVAI